MFWKWTWCVFLEQERHILATGHAILKIVLLAKDYCTIFVLFKTFFALGKLGIYVWWFWWVNFTTDFLWCSNIVKKMKNITWRSEMTAFLWLLSEIFWTKIFWQKSHMIDPFSTQLTILLIFDISYIYLDKARHRRYRNILMLSKSFSWLKGSSFWQWKLTFDCKKRVVS